MNYSLFFNILLGFYIATLLFAVYNAIVMILRKQDPIKTLSWIFALIFLPVIGIIIYLFLGQNHRKKKMFNRKGAGDYNLRRELGQNQEEILKKDPKILDEYLYPFRKIIFQNFKNSSTVIESNSTIDFYFSGKEALDAMYLEIKNAKRHIHLQSYIIENDRIGVKFRDLLIEKANEGLEVRVMYDGVGGISLNSDFISPMIKVGIEVLNFSPVKVFPLRFRLNYRNHRKILVVDGEIGYFGGVNIADRYYYGTEIGTWRDTHVRIKGDTASSLQTSFLLDRYFVLNRKIRKWKKYYPKLDINTPIKKNIEGNSIFSQTVISGPDSDWASIMQCFFSAITHASKHIYIVTPYFTPNETILNAIKIAALGNIDVRIMIPEKSDTKLVHWSTMSYVNELIEAGVKIYLFKKGFNHSKVMSIDGSLCIAGSANMDVRSFEYNFEIISVIYNKDCADIIEKRFLKDCQTCKIITRSKWSKRPRKQKIKESFARLCSPML